MISDKQYNKAVAIGEDLSRRAACVPYPYGDEDAGFKEVQLRVIIDTIANTMSTRRSNQEEISHIILTAYWDQRGRYNATAAIPN